MAVMVLKSHHLGGAAQRQEHQEFKVILTVDWGTAWSAGDPVEKQEAAFENPDS